MLLIEVSCFLIFALSFLATVTEISFFNLCLHDCLWITCQNIPYHLNSLAAFAPESSYRWTDSLLISGLLVRRTYCCHRVVVYYLIDHHATFLLTLIESCCFTCCSIISISLIVSLLIFLENASYLSSCCSCFVGYRFASGLVDYYHL